LVEWFQRRRFLRNQPIKQEWPVAAMFVYGSELKYAIFIEDIPMMLPTKL
jgi:hypothetical protein